MTGNAIGKQLLAVIVLATMVMSLGGPMIGLAEDDDFPLPETFVDDLFADPAAIEGDNGVEGTAGENGVSGLPDDGEGVDGSDGAAEPAGTLEDYLNGSPTTSGQDGTDGKNSNRPWLARAANVYIQTGDASAYASIANYLNTTVIGSSDVDIINIYGPAIGTLDFSDFNSTTTAPDDSYGYPTPTSAEISNNGSISNTVNVEGMSGANRVVGAGGNVVVETGDVYVDASVLNMVNTSLIGRDWRFKIINIFSDLVGDLILPSLYSKQASAGCSGCLSSVNISVGNTASVGNTVVVNGTSGNNSATGTGGQALIETGDTSSVSSVFNVVDTTIIGDDWYFAKFNVTGDWSGSVFNTDSTAEFIDSGDGLTIRGDNGTGNGLGNSSGQVTTNNDANVQNTVTLNADSGNNTVTDANGNVVIKTGDVKAKAAVTNVVNTTVIGDGWQFFLVNIFGNWSGSAYYGMPDLAVSEVAIPSSTPARRGDTITYVYSYTNGGDTTATDVVIRDRFDADKVHVTDTAGGTVRGNAITWRIGNLKPRETRVLSYTTTVNAPDGSLPIQNEVTLAGSNGDRDPSNNATGGQVQIASLPGSQNNSGGGGSGYYYSSGSGGGSSANPEFNLLKATDRDRYSVGETIPFSIILDNFKPNSGYAVGVVDQFFDTENEVVATKVWDLGEVIGFEHIEITYAIPIPAGALPGPYLNKVTVYSKNAGGAILPAVETNLPITVTAAAPGMLDGTAALDEVPNNFLLDLILADDTTEEAEIAVPTSTTDFVVTRSKVTRTTEKEDTPVVYGFTSDDAGGQETLPPAGTSESSDESNNVFWINFGIWLALTVLGLVMLALYRAAKKLLARLRRTAPRSRRRNGVRGSAAATGNIVLALLALVAAAIKQLPDAIRGWFVPKPARRKKSRHNFVTRSTRSSVAKRKSAMAASVALLHPVIQLVVHSWKRFF